MLKKQFNIRLDGDDLESYEEILKFLTEEREKRYERPPSAQDTWIVILRGYYNEVFLEQYKQPSSKGSEENKGH